MMELPKRHATSLYGQPVRTHQVKPARILIPLQAPILGGQHTGTGSDQSESPVSVAARATRATSTVENLVVCFFKLGNAVLTMELPRRHATSLSGNRLASTTAPGSMPVPAHWQTGLRLGLGEPAGRSRAVWAVPSLKMLPQKKDSEYHATGSG